jgi:hypothetical protein
VLEGQWSGEYWYTGSIDPGLLTGSVSFDLEIAKYRLGRFTGTTCEAPPIPFRITGPACCYGRLKTLMKRQ